MGASPLGFVFDGRRPVFFFYRRFFSACGRYAGRRDPGERRFACMEVCKYACDFLIVGVKRSDFFKFRDRLCLSPGTAVDQPKKIPRVGIVWVERDGTGKYYLRIRQAFVFVVEKTQLAQ